MKIAIITYYQKSATNEIEYLTSLGLQVYDFKHLPMIAIKGTKNTIDNLIQNYNKGKIRSIFYNKQLKYFLNESRNLIGAIDIWEKKGITGRDIRVALIDSGIDSTHPDLSFGTKVIQNIKIDGNIFGNVPIIIESVHNSDDIIGHGTFIAGIISGGGQSNNGLYMGIAPGTQIVGISVGEIPDILKVLIAFDYILDKKDIYKIRIINNSWGFIGEFEQDDPINIATKILYEHDITLVFAAGNDGPYVNRLNSYGMASWVINVAAGTKENQLAEFSSRGSEGNEYITLTAPGMEIISTRNSNALFDLFPIGSNNILRYTKSNGSSIAAAHVSGVIAMMLEANPLLKPDEIRKILMQTATPMQNYKMHEVGAGYLNAYEAVKMAIRLLNLNKQ